jgi:hypothetical protein
VKNVPFAAHQLFGTAAD